MRNAKYINISLKISRSTQDNFAENVIAHGPKAPICCSLTRWGATESTSIPHKIQMKRVSRFPPNTRLSDTRVVPSSAEGRTRLRSYVDADEVRACSVTHRVARRHVPHV